MDDEVVFLQIGEINVEGGAGGQGVGRLEPSRALNLVAAKNFGVGDDDDSGLRTNKTPGGGADGDAGFFGAFESIFLPDFLEPLAFPVIVAEDLDRIALAQPAMKLLKKFPALGR